MTTVYPTTRRPTNKLMTAVAIGPAVTEAWGAIMADLYPPLAGTEVSILAGSLAALLFGHFVNDRPNGAT